MFAKSYFRTLISDLDQCLMASAFVILLSCTINSLVWIFVPGNLFALTAVFAVMGVGLFLGLVHLRKLVVIIIFFFAVAFLILQTVLIDWDARAIWLYHAKFIFFDGSYYASLAPYDTSHPDYPVVYSAMMASVVKVIGQWNEIYPNIAMLPFIVAPVLLLCLHFKGWLAHILLVSVLILTCKIQLINGYMDGLVGLHAVAIIFLCKKFSESGSNQVHLWINYRMLFLVFALTVNLTTLKNEGLAIALVLVATGFFVENPVIRRSLWFGLLFGLVFYGLTWKIPLILSSQGTDLFAGSIGERVLSRLGSMSSFTIIKALLGDLWRWLLLLGVIKIFSKTHRIVLSEYKAAWVFCLLYYFILLCVYLGAHHDLAWHLATSAGRVSTPIAMVLAIIFAHWFCKNPYMRNSS
jgi:hypothetical protein